MKNSEITKFTILPLAAISSISGQRRAVAHIYKSAIFMSFKPWNCNPLSSEQTSVSPGWYLNNQGQLFPPLAPQLWLQRTLCHCCIKKKTKPKNNHHSLVDGLAQSFWQVLIEAAVITHLNLIYFYFRKLPNNTKDFFPASHWNCVHIAMATMPEIFVVQDPFYWLLNIYAIKKKIDIYI